MYLRKDTSLLQYFKRLKKHLVYLLEYAHETKNQKFDFLLKTYLKTYTVYLFVSSITLLIWLYVFRNISITTSKNEVI